jgi:hypothetical protein
VLTDFAVFMGKLFLPMGKQAHPGFVTPEVLTGDSPGARRLREKQHRRPRVRDPLHTPGEATFHSGATAVQLFQEKTRGRVSKLDPEAVEPVVVAILPNRADQKPE